MQYDGVFYHRFRYFILGMSFFSLMSVSSNISAFNIAQICMAGNDTKHIGFFKPVEYSASQVSTMNGAVGLGLLIATLPVTRLYQKYGTYWPLLISGLISATITGLLPFAIEIHFYLAVALRFIQGVCFAVDFPTVGSICSNWASLKQTAFFIAVLTSYSAFATSITDSLGGIICATDFGWPSVFFAHSIVGFIIFGISATFFTNKPQDNSFINERSKLLVFNSITMFLPGLLFILVTFLPSTQSLLIVIDFGLVNFFCGAASAGFYKCGALYGRQYGQFILSMFQFLKSITLFLGPAIFAVTVQDPTAQAEWSRIFWLFGLTLILSNVLFFKFGTAEPASYAIDQTVLKKNDISESQSQI